MNLQELTVGDTFADKDPNRVGRQYKVISIIKRPEYEVRKDMAVCLSRGKVTPVAVARLLHPSRFMRVVPSVQG